MAAAYARRVRWTEPSVWREPPRGTTVAADALALRGLDQVRAIREPPAMYHLTGTKFDSAEPGLAVFSMPITGWLRTSQGAVLGGMLAVPGDAALGCAIHTRLDTGVHYTTAELSLTYLRPLAVGSRVTARGRAVHVGRRLALSSCEITGEDGELLAYATSRCSVFATEGSPLRSGTAPPPPPAVPPSPTPLPDPFEREPAGAVLERTVWDDLSGLDVLRRQISSELPHAPLHHLFGITPVAADPAEAVCAMPLSGWLNTPWGWPQGGFIAVLADASLGMAVQTTIPAGSGFATVDIKVNYVRPVAADGGVLQARASVVHRGRSLAVARAEVSDDRGRLVALATGSAQILPTPAGG